MPTPIRKRKLTPFNTHGSAVGPRLGVCAYYTPGSISDTDRRARFRQVEGVPGALVVMNVASGPGATANPVEAQARAEMAQAGQTVLGYVSTRDASVKRPAADVKADIDAWVTLYGVDGIFLDEGEPGQTNTDLAYYTDLASYVRGKDPALVVAYNPGTHPHTDYYAVFDVIMVVEHAAATFLDDSQVPDLPENRRGPARVWALVHSISTEAQAVAVMDKARRLGLHWLTMQDTDTDQTWHALLPSKWLWDMQAAPTPRPSQTVASSRLEVTLGANYGAVAWSAMPAAMTELKGNTMSRVKVDLAGMTRARLTTAIGTAGATGATLAVQYATDGDTQASWAYLDGSTGPVVPIDTAGGRTGAWVDIAPAARTEVWLRVVGAGGDGTKAPTIGTTALHLTGPGATPSSGGETPTATASDLDALMGG